ncbi:hypothetical protein [Sphingomonas sp. MS122]|uniref:hypothetical protein n=1 Tax=Sphingomonas sp. MS122 TaxID=3412683 RepID=UPI003C2D8D7E
MRAATDILKERLRADLLDCMRRRRPLEAATIRSLLAALDNAEAVPRDTSRSASHPVQFGDGSAEVARRELSRAQALQVIQEEASKYLDAATDLERLGQPDHAERLREEARIAQRYVA